MCAYTRGGTERAIPSTISKHCFYYQKLLLLVSEGRKKLPTGVAYRGRKRLGVMTDYEGPLKMLQPKTYLSLLGLCGKDGSNQNGLGCDYWNDNDNNSQKLQVG